MNPWGRTRPTSLSWWLGGTTASNLSRKTTKDVAFTASRKSLQRAPYNTIWPSCGHARNEEFQKPNSPAGYGQGSPRHQHGIPCHDDGVKAKLAVWGINIILAIPLTFRGHTGTDSFLNQLPSNTDLLRPGTSRKVA